MYELTVAIAIMSSDFFSDSNRLDYAERNVSSLPKQLDVVITVVLGNKYQSAIFAAPSGRCLIGTRKGREKLTLTKRAGPRNRWFFFSCFE